MVLPICGNMDDFKQMNAILIQVKNQNREYSFGVDNIDIIRLLELFVNQLPYPYKNCKIDSREGLIHL